MAISRAKTLKGLNIKIPGIPSFRAMIPASNKSSEIIDTEIFRLRSTQLITKYDHLYDMKVPMMMVHNIQSYRRHGRRLMDDKLFSSSEVVVLTETWLRSDDLVSIPQIETIRLDCDESQRARGILILVKLGSDFHKIHGKRYIDGAGSSLDLIAFSWRKVNFIAVYKQCGMKLISFINFMDQFIADTFLCNSSVSLIGDFNLNFKVSHQELDKFFARHRITPYFTSSSSTEYGTLIDNLITSSQHLKAEFYENLCSHHKPICIIQEENHGSDMDT